MAKSDKWYRSEEELMGATVGDRVELQPKSVHAQGRSGTVEEVLSESPSRYQVRWDDGRWSIIAATDGSLRVVSPSMHLRTVRSSKPIGQHKIPTPSSY